MPPPTASPSELKRQMQRDEWIQEAVTLLFWVPALTAVVFLRHKLGFRMIRPLFFMTAFAALFVLAGVGALSNRALASLPAGLVSTEVTEQRQQEQQEAEQRALALARAREISPNAGQLLSSPETDPEAYEGAPAGMRFMRMPDGTWGRNLNTNRRVLERIPEQPTVIPPEDGPQAANIDIPGGPSWLSRIPALVLFAVPMLVLSVYHRRRGYQLIFSEQWHSKYGGVPHLQRVLPFTEPTITRRVEPLLVALLGVVVLYFFSSILFGLWLVFAGLTLGVAEQMLYERRLNNMLDRLDARVEAKWAEEEDARIKNGGRASQTAAATGGYLVTVAPELEALLRNTDGEEDEEEEISDQDETADDESLLGSMLWVQRALAARGVPVTTTAEDELRRRGFEVPDHDGSYEKEEDDVLDIEMLLARIGGIRDELLARGVPVATNADDELRRRGVDLAGSQNVSS